MQHVLSGSRRPSSRPPIAPAVRTLTPRSFDAAVELALQLAIARETHDLEVVLIADARGRVVSSAGDDFAAGALAHMAAGVLRDAEFDEPRVLLDGRYYFERLRLDGETCLLAAQSVDKIEYAMLIGESIREIFPEPTPMVESGVFAKVAADEEELDLFADDFG